jgi:hypothetical protein
MSALSNPEIEAVSLPAVTPESVNAILAKVYLFRVFFGRVVAPALAKCDRAI